MQHIDRTAGWMVATAWAGLLLIAGIGAAGCTSSAEPPSYEQQVLQHRVEREMNLRDKNSVLPPSARKRFKGLNHYPVDSTYRFTAPLEPAATPDTVWMVESTGGMAPRVRVGHVDVPFPEDTARLSVFRVQGQEPLWIPFGDATNQSATYPAGRYLDAPMEDDSTLVLDFNKAYNPTCDYNPNYTCPLPPSENRVALAIPAGEQRSNLHPY
ncbi:MAG: DUF1684 domain-containing protein [Bacteroidetes bacterium]|nr:DUF1684 domain-containing protein [Bacteroidota bacterium]